MVVMLPILFKRRRVRRLPVNHRIADTARYRRDTEKDPPSQARWQARAGNPHHLAPRPQEQRHRGPQLLTDSTVPRQVKSARTE
jgi:hypothetical protein